MGVVVGKDGVRDDIHLIRLYVSDLDLFGVKELVWFEELFLP